MTFSHNKTYEMDMANGAILPKMLLFALPLTCSSILQLLFNAADIIVVGRFAGDNSLAAVGSTASIIQLLVNLFIGLSVGANIIAARYYGAGKKEDLRKTVHTALLVSLISGIFLSIVGICGAKTVLIWMQSPSEVLDLATVYLRIYSLGMPALMLYNFGAALLRAVGDTRRPLYYLLSAGVVNVVLNLFFVIVCHLDVAGVAIATIVSQYISAFLVIRCMLLDPGVIHLELQQLRMDPTHLKQLLQVGIPAGLQNALFSLSNVVIQSSINAFGETVVAGSSASANIEGFVYASINAFHQAAISFTCQSYGAGRYDRILPILLRAQACVIVAGGGLGALSALLGPWLLGLYSESDAVIAAGMDRLVIICGFSAICGMMDVMAGSLRGLGYSLMPMLITLIGACALRLVWIATVFQMPEYHTIQTVYISYPITWVITFFAHAVFFLWGIRHIKRDLSETAP